MSADSLILQLSSKVIVMAAWERRERDLLDARRCDDPECRALPPNHTTECGKRPLPDPGAERHGCGYVLGTLGCRMVHRRRSSAPDGPEAA